MTTAPDKCPDTGACHHNCGDDGPCWRVLHCGPLSIAKYPGDSWPAEVEAAELRKEVHRLWNEPLQQTIKRLEVDGFVVVSRETLNKQQAPKAELRTIAARQELAEVAAELASEREKREEAEERIAELEKLIAHPELDDPRTHVELSERDCMSIATVRIGAWPLCEVRIQGEQSDARLWLSLPGADCWRDCDDLGEACADHRQGRPPKTACEEDPILRAARLFGAASNQIRSCMPREDRHSDYSEERLAPDEALAVEDGGWDALLSSAALDMRGIAVEQRAGVDVRGAWQFLVSGIRAFEAGESFIADFRRARQLLEGSKP